MLWLLSAVELFPSTCGSCCTSDVRGFHPKRPHNSRCSSAGPSCTVPVQKAGAESHLLCRRCVLVKELWDQVKEIHKEISRLHSILTRGNREDNLRLYRHRRCRWALHCISQSHKSERKTVTLHKTSVPADDLTLKTGLVLSKVRRRWAKL